MWNHKRFTGFKISWYCHTCNGKRATNPDFTFRKRKHYENLLFIMIANLIHFGQKHDIPTVSIWEKLRTAKLNWYEIIAEYYPNKMMTHYNGAYSEKRYIYTEIFKDIKLENIGEIIDTYTYNVTDETLETAAKMFIYLTAPPKQYWINALDIYKSWLEKLSPIRILGIF